MRVEFVESEFADSTRNVIIRGKPYVVPFGHLVLDRQSETFYVKVKGIHRDSKGNYTVKIRANESWEVFDSVREEELFVRE